MKVAILLVQVSLITGLARGVQAQSKLQCTTAHASGQEARAANRLTEARKQFLTCAQRGCPALVADDCAKMLEQATAVQPTVRFVARDESGVDLSGVTIAVDEVVVVAGYDDGRPVEMDPGRHVIRFTHGTATKELTVVIGEGEKARVISAIFESDRPQKSSSVTNLARPVAIRKTIRPMGAKVLVIAGGALVTAGVGVALWGVTSVPAACSYKSRQCAAPANDPVFNDAKSAAQKVNLGMIAGGIGVAALAGGIYWYVTGDRVVEQHVGVTPWVSPTGAGLAVASSF